MKKSKLKSKIRTTATITLAGLSSSAFAIENTVKDNVSENKSENVQSLPANMSLSAEKTANFIDYVTPSPFRLVKYYNSINIEEGSTGGAFFQPSNNLIYNNRGSKESKIDLILELAHEVHHRDVQEQGARAQDMSPVEYYKIQCLEEISSCFIECLVIREKYKEAADKKAYLEDLCANSIIAESYKYYIDKLKDGTFSPSNGSQENFDAEMTYLINKTRQTWLEDSQDEYCDRHCSSARTHCCIKGVSGKSNSDNYNQAIRKMYTIGGIDFSKYLFSFDIPLSPRAVDQLSKITVDPQKQEMRFDELYCTKANSKQNNLRFEKKPNTLTIPNLSPNSNILLQERECAKKNVSTANLAMIYSLNDMLCSDMKNENITYTAGTMEKLSTFIQKYDIFEYQANQYAEKICKRFGDKSLALLDVIVAHPSAVMLNHQNILCKKFHPKEALIWLANGSNLTNTQADILLSNYEKSFQAISLGMGIVSSKDNSGLNNNMYNLRIAESVAFTAATYLQDQNDYSYLTSVLKMPDNHPEFWDTFNGYDIKKIHQELFNGSMTVEKFKRYMVTYELCQPVKEIIMKKALQDNKTADAEDKIKLKEISAITKYLLSEYGSDGAQKIAMAMVASPKEFGGKSLAKIIHTSPKKDKETKEKYQARLNKENFERFEQISQYARQHNIVNRAHLSSKEKQQIISPLSAACHRL